MVRMFENDIIPEHLIYHTVRCGGTAVREWSRSLYLQPRFAIVNVLTTRNWTNRITGQVAQALGRATSTPDLPWARRWFG